EAPPAARRRRGSPGARRTGGPVLGAARVRPPGRGVPGAASLTLPRRVCYPGGHGLRVLAGGGGVPRGASRVARSGAAGPPGGVAGHRRRVHAPSRPVLRRLPGLASTAAPRRLGRARLAAGVRRPRGEP